MSYDVLYCVEGETVCKVFEALPRLRRLDCYLRRDSIAEWAIVANGYLVRMIGRVAVVLRSLKSVDFCTLVIHVNTAIQLDVTEEAVFQEMDVELLRLIDAHRFPRFEELYSARGYLKIGSDTGAWLKLAHILALRQLFRSSMDLSMDRRCSIIGFGQMNGLYLGTCHNLIHTTTPFPSTPKDQYATTETHCKTGTHPRVAARGQPMSIVLRCTVRLHCDIHLTRPRERGYLLGPPMRSWSRSTLDFRHTLCRPY
ncbi:hypothetical protein GY45DRAFT_694444 [Cubamyces sp. BRFM 1775]|nr:hypothetical protein GY45DRAFT_694444 [Cubamyces sp. BRFM 1775]